MIPWLGDVVATMHFCLEGAAARIAIRSSLARGELTVDTKNWV